MFNTEIKCGPYKVLVIEIILQTQNAFSVNLEMCFPDYQLYFMIKGLMAQLRNSNIFTYNI